MKSELPSASARLTRRRALLMLGAASWPALGLAKADASAFASNFGGMALTDQNGRRFDFNALAGRVLVVNFVFTGCSTICPMQTRVLADVLGKQAQGGSAAPLQFVSLSLDPLQDTPAALKAFGQRMGADFKRWSFLTGRPEDIDRISDRLRLFRPGPAVRRPDDHATTLWLVDARGQLRQRLHGNPPDAKRLAAELTTLRLSKT